MLKVRLQRKGKKKQAFFRIVLQEHTEKLQGKYLELLGTYDPHSKELKIDREQVEQWVAKGAQVSPTLNNLMVNHKVWERPKVQSWRPKVKEGGEQPAATAPAPAAPEKPVQEAPAEVSAQKEESTTGEAPAATA